MREGKDLKDPNVQKMIKMRFPDASQASTQASTQAPTQAPPAKLLFNSDALKEAAIKKQKNNENIEKNLLDANAKKPANNPGDGNSMIEELRQKQKNAKQKTPLTKESVQPQTNQPAKIKSPVNSAVNPFKSAASAQTVEKPIAKPILNAAPTNNAATTAQASKPKRGSYVRRKAKELASGFASLLKGTKKKKNATTTQTLTTYNENTASPNGDGKTNKQKPGKT